MGTTLKPGGGDSQYGDWYKNRGAHVWIDSQSKAHSCWSFPEDFIYEVKPSEEPQPWVTELGSNVNVKGVEGYTVPSATIIKVIRRPLK